VLGRRALVVGAQTRAFVGAKARAASMDRQQRRPQKKALCVGLNYARQKQFKLYGCVNDCLNWEHVLKQTFAFDETRVLIDQHPDGQLATADTQIPSRNNILAQLSWLCSTAEAGDVLVFVFAGHGCQVRNSNGEVDQALVPDDFGLLDEHGNPPLVMDDEIHALFQLLPAGTFLTVILDCCHSTRMLDVDHSFDTSQRPAKLVQVCEKPREVPHCTADVWQKSYIHHASARPRFIPTVALTGPPRKRRTPPGTGAHVGKMSLNPGVTAFSFHACRPAEFCLDANITNHQQGVMSFCLLEVLAQEHRITYEKWLDKAAQKMEDIRKEYMPMMEQYMQLSFCANSAPAEVVVLDPQYAPVAQHRLYQRAKLADRGQSADNQNMSLSSGPQDRRPTREASSDFVPSPVYTDLGYGKAAQQPQQPQQQQQAQQPVGNGASGHPPVAAYLYIRVRCANKLKNTGSGFFGDTSTPYVVVKVGQQQKRTPEIKNELNPVWYQENEFAFSIFEQDHVLDLSVMSANRFKDQLLGRTLVDLPHLPPGPWHTRTDPMQDGSGELEYDVRIDRSPAGVQSAPQGQGMPNQCQQPAQQPAPQQQAPMAKPQTPATAGRDLLGEPPRMTPEQAFAAQQNLANTNVTPTAAPGNNMFGQPNLFGNVPNLLAGLNVPGQAPLSAAQPYTTGPAMGAATLGRPMSVQGSSAAAAYGAAAAYQPAQPAMYAAAATPNYAATTTAAPSYQPSYTGYAAPSAAATTTYASPAAATPYASPGAAYTVAAGPPAYTVAGASPAAYGGTSYTAAPRMY